MSALQKKPETAVSALSDTELEAHIIDCGRQMEACMARWEAHGNFADRGESLFWLNEQMEAIKARGGNAG